MSTAPLESVIASLGKLTQTDFDEVASTSNSHTSEDLSNIVNGLLGVVQSADLKFIPTQQ